MGGLSSAVEGKFVRIGEEFVGEEQKSFSSVNIYKVRFLKPKVIDRTIVQLRLQVKVGNQMWNILRSLEDFRLLKESLTLPSNFIADFPDTGKRRFPDDNEIMAIQSQMSKWLMEALTGRNNLPPMLTFLGVMGADTAETTNTSLDMNTLIRTCETGDILLFRTCGFLPSSIRRITNSNYDHVAVVVVRERDDGESEACFLEASGDQYGVYIHSLRSRLREWFLAGAQISYRRLRCERDTRFKIRSKSFVEKVQGLKYGYNVKTLMLNQKDQWPADKSRFFCSELVAAYYKHLGFIQSFAKSHTYMPGDFAERGVVTRLNLVDAILEHEIKVTKCEGQPPALSATPSEVTETSREPSISLPSCCDGLSLYSRRSSSELFRRQRTYSRGSGRVRLDDLDDEKHIYPFDEMKTGNQP